MKIRYVEKLEGSPVLQFVTKAWGALMDEGHWNKTSVLINGAESCVYVTVGRETVGCIVYRIIEETGDAVIAIAYVVKKHRRKGFYVKMHDEFEKRAKSAGAKTAVNICYTSNVAIQETVKKLGYELPTQEWRKAL